MIYLLHGMSQKPKKMADGGVSTLPGNVAAPQQTTGGGNDASVQAPDSSIFYKPQVVGASAVGASIGNLASSMTPQSGYQAQLAPTTQMDYTGLINNSATQFQNNVNAQNNLAGQFQQTANGQGPNPVQSQLATNTGQNVAQQAALMAGQRGAGANVGMMARQAGMAGANIQQQAVGQAATLGAQQQLQAQQNLMNVYNNIGSETGGMFGTAANSLNAQNANLVNNYSQMQGTNAQTAAQNAAGERTMLGNLANSGSSMMSMFMADGGEVPNQKELYCYADGGNVNGMGPVADSDSYGPMLDNMQGTQGIGPVYSGQTYGSFLDSDWNSSDAARRLGGQSDVQPDDAQQKGKKQQKQTQMMQEPSISFTHQQYSNPYIHASSGATVPGKANVAGDSEENDTVHALLSPGEIVVPRSAAQSPDKAAAFAKSVAMRSSRKGKK